MPQSAPRSSVHPARKFFRRGLVPLIASFAAGGSCTPLNVLDLAPVPGLSAQVGLPPISNRDHLRRRFNEERQKAIASDSQKLVQLAAELNNKLSTEKEGPSLADLHDLDQIQKLARRVKNRMNVVLLDGPPFSSVP